MDKVCFKLINIDAHICCKKQSGGVNRVQLICKTGDCYETILDDYLYKKITPEALVVVGKNYATVTIDNITIAFTYVDNISSEAHMLKLEVENEELRNENVKIKAKLAKITERIDKLESYPRIYHQMKGYYKVGHFNQPLSIYEFSSPHIINYVEYCYSSSTNDKKIIIEYFLNNKKFICDFDSIKEKPITCTKLKVIVGTDDAAIISAGYIPPQN
jgi:hypothetical protein